MLGSQGEIWNCRVDASGRIVLPLPYRSEKKLKTGDEIVVTIEDGAAVLRTYDQVMSKLQEQFCESLPKDTSLVDELLADRRKEADLEESR